MRYSGIVRLLCAACGWLVCAAALAATADQEQKAQAIEDELKQAAKLVGEKKFAEAAPLVSDAQEKLKELASEGPAVKALVEKLHGKLAAAHRQVAKGGVELPALEKIEAKTSKPTKGGKNPEPAKKGISFMNDVVPIMVANCSGCHIGGTRGGFNMDTYNALIKGSTAGTVFTAGKGKGSRFIDVLESGDMPRGRGKLKDEEIALITKWIDDGAKFDGKDPAAMLSNGTPAPVERPKLEVVAASGNETSRFSRDIAPVLAERCTGCHGGRQPSAQLRLETFAGVLAGNNDGLIIKPGDSVGSLIIKKLKGTAGARMPLNQTPLTDETISLFEKWVAEGAKFDGTSANDPVEFVANVYKASVMSHDELKAYRDNLAIKNWQLSNPDVAPDKAETENFLLYGNVGQDRLAEMGKLAEQQVPAISGFLGAPRDKPLFKGRMTLFAFNRRYDYSEFGQMVEKREIPGLIRGHFKFNVVDAYGCIVPPDSSGASLKALVGQQIAGAYLQSLGPKLPDWFAQGSSWAIGAKLDGKDPFIKQLDSEIGEAVKKATKTDDFITNSLPPEEGAVLSYSFAKYLVDKKGQYSKLLGNLRKGTPFEQAFQQAYGGTPAEATKYWAAGLSVSSGKKRSK